MPIVSIGHSNPLEDGRQSDRALMIQRGMSRHMEALGMVVLSEFSLSSGRRADLIGLDRKGCFVIVEIKSSIEDFRTDNKWPEYAAYCDRFWFATHAGVPAEIFPPDQGLYIADDYGAHVIRDALEDRLPAPTRKALTLRFARQAALRAGRVSEYALSNLGRLPGIEDID